MHQEEEEQVKERVKCSSCLFRASLSACGGSGGGGGEE